MKLAQALNERADLNRRIYQLEDRLRLNAKVQEGETPAEDPQALLAELDELLRRQEELIARINLTNASVTSQGQTLTELLARRDCLALRARMMREFLDEASATAQRGMRTEIRIVSTVDVRRLRKETDEVSRQLRELDLRIQELNWTTPLRED